MEVTALLQVTTVPVTPRVQGIQSMVKLVVTGKMPEEVVKVGLMVTRKALEVNLQMYVNWIMAAMVIITAVIYRMATFIITQIQPAVH